MSSLLIKGINRNAEIYIECAINIDILLYMVSVNASTNIATYIEYANKEAIGHKFYTFPWCDYKYTYILYISRNQIEQTVF